MQLPGIEVSYIASNYSIDYELRGSGDQDLSGAEWARLYKIAPRSHVLRIYEQEGLPMVVVHMMQVGTSAKFRDWYELSESNAALMLTNNPQDARIRPAPKVDDVAHVQRSHKLVELDPYLNVTYWALMATQSVVIATPSSVAKLDGTPLRANLQDGRQVAVSTH